MTTSSFDLLILYISLSAQTIQTQKLGKKPGLVCTELGGQSADTDTVAVNSVGGLVWPSWSRYRNTVGAECRQPIPMTGNKLGAVVVFSVVQ